VALKISFEEYHGQLWVIKGKRGEGMEDGEAYGYQATRRRGRCRCSRRR
jgi:hypothetical protein